MNNLFAVSLFVVFALPSCALLNDFGYRGPDEKGDLFEQQIALDNQRKKEKEDEERAKLQTQEQYRARYHEYEEKEDIRLERAVRKQIEEDEALGYKHISFADFQLDQKTMPLGTKLAISGFYWVEGQIETLSLNIAPQYVATTSEIVLLTESASRPTRQRLLECRDRPFCKLMVLGHTAECKISWLGRPVSTRICLIVENTWEPIAGIPFPG